MTNYDEEGFSSLIEQWNTNRLDLFAVQGPNQHGEFWGVIRFCFQDAGQKVATKCVRVSNAATTADVIPVLVEKFRADIRMLSTPEYGLYEIHENGEERKLEDDENPLTVQLNWAKDDREGRFLLRRMDDKSTGERASESKKDKKKKEKKKKKKERSDESTENKCNGKNKLAEKLYTELPDSCFTRSISNPEAVMRRRRKQKLEQKLQQLSQEGGSDAGGTLRIFGECLNKDVPYKTLLLSTKDTAAFVVEQILDKYRDIDQNLRESDIKKAEPASNYCLAQVIETANQVEGQQTNFRHFILDDDECPLLIKKRHNPVNGQLTFHIMKRPLDYEPRKRKKKFDQDHKLDPFSPEKPQRINPSLPQNQSRFFRITPTPMPTLTSNIVAQNYQRISTQVLPQIPMHYQTDNNLRIYGNIQGIVRMAKPSSESVQLSRQIVISPPSMYYGGPPNSTIKLQKRNGGLGLSIVAAKSLRNDRLGIYIKSVVKDGAADLDGRLQSGDQLLSVDKKSLIGITQEEAANIMAKTDQIVVLEVLKQAAFTHGLAGFPNEAIPTTYRAERVSLENSVEHLKNRDSSNDSSIDLRLPPRISTIPGTSQTLPPNSLQNNPLGSRLKRNEISHTLFPNQILETYLHHKVNTLFNYVSPETKANHKLQIYRDEQTSHQKTPNPITTPNHSACQNKSNHSNLLNPVAFGYASSGRIESNQFQMSPKEIPKSPQRPPPSSSVPIQSKTNNYQALRTSPVTKYYSTNYVRSSNMIKGDLKPGRSKGEKISPSIPTPATDLSKTGESSENERCTPEDHSFTLRDISEVLELDEEQDFNTKGGCTPNVIGAQEIYRDPRERINAEKMRNQFQQNIVGPEKLSLKEKMKLFEQEGKVDQD